MSQKRREKIITIGALVLLLIIIFFAGYKLHQNALEVMRENQDPLEKDCQKIFTAMRTELVYAHDVTNNRHQPNKKHNWHCLYIQNGILYKDKHPIFKEEWFDDRQVAMTYVGYIRSKSRIDFTLTITEKGRSYSMRQSLKLLSIDLKNSIDKRLPTGEETYDLSVDHTKLNKKKYKLYYYN